MKYVVSFYRGRQFIDIHGFEIGKLHKPNFILICKQQKNNTHTEHVHGFSTLESTKIPYNMSICSKMTAIFILLKNIPCFFNLLINCSEIAHKTSSNSEGNQFRQHCCSESILVKYVQIFLNTFAEFGQTVPKYCIWKKALN